MPDQQETRCVWCGSRQHHPDRCPKAPSERATHEPAAHQARCAVMAWLGAAQKLSREIFALSQQPGVPESARKSCDEARESLRHARVNMQFEAAQAPNQRLSTPADE